MPLDSLSLSLSELRSHTCMPTQLLAEEEKEKTVAAGSQPSTSSSGSSKVRPPCSRECAHSVISHCPTFRRRGSPRLITVELAGTQLPVLAVWGRGHGQTCRPSAKPMAVRRARYGRLWETSVPGSSAVYVSLPLQACGCVVLCVAPSFLSTIPQRYRI